MRQLKYIHAVLAVLASWALVSCTIDERYPVVGERESVVTFTPVLSGDMQTRAIGDAKNINQLVVCVFEGSKKVLRQDLPWDEVSSGVSLTLIEGRNYNILFWAQCKDNGAYEIDEDGSISVTYNSFLTRGFSAMEKMDAFYAVVTDVKIGSAANQAMGTITLTRPLAQVNFADNATAPVPGEHRSVVTFQNYPTSFDPFTGSVGVTTDELVFTFTDFPSEPLSSGEVDYHYLSCNYFFAMTDSPLSATLEFQTADGSTTIKTVSVQEVPLEPNKKTNVIGSIVQEPETWSVWDGETQTRPMVDAENRYVIDEASDLAWLAENGLQLTERTKFLQKKDIDMNDESISSIKLPVGSTYDGGGKTIKNFANSLFGDATSLTVEDLAVENITASGSIHIGTLVNTLKGSSSFTNVSVTNSSATTTAGAAGGMVGYIVRTSEKDRDETLSVSFSGCKLNGVTVSGSASEGKFVGLLSGYDNNESLTFDAGCEATDVFVEDYASVYVEANNSAWAGDVAEKYNGWLGAETYRRAKVTFAGVRLAPRWDGTTATAKADLLLYNGESNKYEVHSPFDLAGVRNATASPAALYLMENVDMFGQGEDGEFFVHSNFTKSACNSADDNNFDAFTSIALLEGNNKGIYNVALNSEGSDRYAFILNGDNGHIHKNVSFHNCCTVVPHVVGEEDNGQTVDKSYGATVVLSVGGATYTMSNVNAYGCKVFALQKTGILAGRIVSTSKATISDCNVDGCYIENYKCQEHKELFQESIVSAEFYSYGEIGALTGFINYNATITNCSVINTRISAFGQSDQKGNILNIIKAGTIPGRHVNQFIGDIRSKEGYTVSISDCSVSDNQYLEDEHSHSKGTSVPVIGEAYCLGAKIIFIGQKGDKKGTVKIKNITIDGAKKFTSETSVTLQELM